MLYFISGRNLKLNRLPVSEDKLSLILSFLKDNPQNAYSRRQIAKHLWNNYSFCDFKTFDQLNREVSDKISKHVNKQNYYTQTVPCQITEHNTFPFTYQYCGEMENTKLEYYQKSFDFENTPKILMTENDNAASSHEVVDEVADEAILVQDVQAATKINFDLVLDGLSTYLKDANNKQEAVMRVLKVIVAYA